MSRWTVTSPLGLALCVVLVALCSALVSADSTYTITDLGTLGGTTSWANGINASGQVVGYSSTGSTTHAFLYSNGTMVDLGVLPGGTDSHATAINSSGQVVGDAALPTGNAARHAFLYSGVPGSGGAMADLGTLGGNWSWAYGINDSGQVVGRAYGASTADAFLYSGVPSSGGAMVDLGSLGGADSWAFGINESGQIVGYSDGPGPAPWDGFLYTGIPGKGGSMVNLDNPGDGSSFAAGINDSGEIVGTAYMGAYKTSTVRHAFLYTGTPGSGGSMLDLGADLSTTSEILHGTESFATSILNSGQVVGYLYTTLPGPYVRAFTYTGGALQDLNGFIDDSSWLLEFANSGNDAGQIVGAGIHTIDGVGYNRAFLLTPNLDQGAGGATPELPPVALLTALPLGIAWLRRRRVA